MIRHTPIVHHDPLLNLQVITTKDASDIVQTSRLIIFVDTDEDDLNRTVTNYTVDHPHLYDLSIAIEGFDNYQGSELEKFVSGTVFLVGKRNNISKSTPVNGEDFKILLAEPKISIQPDKTNKRHAQWHSIADVKQQISYSWIQAFSTALSGYLVHSYNQFNADSIKKAVQSATENTNEYTNLPSPPPQIYRAKSGNTFFEKIKLNSKGLTAIASIVGAVSLVLLSYNLGANKSSQSISGTANGVIPIAQPMSVEEAKKAQLRELGINPDDLAADLGCFVE